MIRESTQTLFGTGESTEEQISEAQEKLAKEAPGLFCNPEVRDFIENVWRSHEQIIDNVNLDTVQKEETADRVIGIFREFIEENKDEIIALRIVYSETYKDRPMVIEQFRALYEKLRAKGVTVERLWDCYAIKKPEKVKRGVVAQLADLVSITRFEMGYAD